MSAYSSTSFGDLVVYGLFALVSLMAGLLVVILFLVATGPLVAIYPASSGAQEVVIAVAILWGVVVGCVVGVFTLGPWHRHRARGQHYEAFEAEAPRRRVPAPGARRRPANDYDEDGFLILDDADERRA